MYGLYIHIPFCRQACHYCNFHFSTNLKNTSEIVSAICSELNERKDFLPNTSLGSVYLGGGTPSILGDKDLELIFDTIHDLYSIASDCEVTIECNPEDIIREKLRFWWDIGINRLSIGIQSFIENDLKFMNRAHSAAQSYRALSAARDSPFSNITADLMFGLVNSTLENWKTNIKTILQYDLPHLSIYNLTVEEQTAFAYMKQKNRLQLPSDVMQEKQFELTRSLLNGSGYNQYEISNYARDGFEAIHNQNYWNRVPYLGVGPSAHSFNDNIRSWNISNNQKYLNQWKSGSFVRETETLTIYDIINEQIMLGLRTQKGVDGLRTFAEHHAKVHLIDQISAYIKEGNLQENGSTLTLHPDKWYLADSIASSLFITDDQR